VSGEIGATPGVKVKVIDNLWRGSLKNLKNENGTPIIDLENDFLSSGFD
jgi:hypothetical protein